MVAPAVTFDLKQLEGQLLRISRRAKNFDNSILTALLLEHVEDNFDSQGAKGDQGKWAPLAATTIERHPNRSSGSLLFDTGLLANWQTATQGDTSIVWSPAPYAKFHVTGTENMPVRNPFAIGVNRFMDQAERLVALEIGR